MLNFTAREVFIIIQGFRRIKIVYMETTFISILIMAFSIGIASGSIGSFVILRRMALVGDAMSHVALPGIALALAYHLDPFWGVLVFLLGAAVLIWWLENRTKLSAEALVGVLFTASLAIGVLTIPDLEIIESLFGSFPNLSTDLLFLILGASIALTFFSFFFTPKFLFATLSPELARIEDPKRRWDLLFFLFFAFTVALGIKLVGTLLMGALTIIPALIAKNMARSITSYLILSTFFGGLVASGGIILARYFGFLPGPVIILLGIILFIISIFFGKKS